MTLVQDVFHSCVSKWDSKNKLMPNVILLVQYSIINISRRAEQRILQIAQKSCMLCRTQSCCCRFPTKHWEYYLAPLSNTYKAWQHQDTYKASRQYNYRCGEQGCILFIIISNFIQDSHGWETARKIFKVILIISVNIMRGFYLCQSGSTAAHQLHFMHIPYA